MCVDVTDYLCMCECVRERNIEKGKGDANRKKPKSFVCARVCVFWALSFLNVITNITLMVISHLLLFILFILALCMTPDWRMTTDQHFKLGVRKRERDKDRQMAQIHDFYVCSYTNTHTHLTKSQSFGSFIIKKENRKPSQFSNSHIVISLMFSVRVCE